jgi:6-phosphogluconate dehydrogenase
MMQIGVIGLGRTGAGLARRLMHGGHDCVAYDVESADSLHDFVAKLDRPCVLWITLPASVAGDTIDRLVSILRIGDVVIDGGNGDARDAIERARRLGRRGIHFIDVGTSGGVMNVRGNEAVVDHVDPIFRTVALGAYLRSDLDEHSDACHASV